MYWLVPLPVVLPLLFAAGLVASAPICRRRVADLTSIATAAAATIACCFLIHFSAENTIIYWFGSWLPRGGAAIGISFAVDPLGAGAAAFCSLLTLAALVYCWEYFKTVRTYFHALILIFLAAMNGFCLTGDLFNLFVFFELMSVVAYALTAYKVEETQALAGAMNFAVTNSVGAFLALIGIGLIYGRTGALNMAQAGQSLAQHSTDPLVVVALTLVLCGFFVKAAVTPFHFWLADAHAVAPTPVCVLFSGIMIELGLYGGFRVFWTVFHPVLGNAGGGVRTVLMGVGAATAVLGAVMCSAQRHFKRLLAFSSISHIGMMLVGAACLTAKGVAGAALYLLGHGFAKGSLFMSAGILLNRFGSVDQNVLFGRGRNLFVLGTVCALGGLGLAGFPPFGTYLGKQMMEEAGHSVGARWLTWLFVFCSAVTGGAVLRIAAMIFLGWGTLTVKEKHSPTATEEQPEIRKKTRRIPDIMLSVAVLLALAPMVSGFVGNRLATGIESSAARFLDQGNYSKAVLNGSDSGPIQTQETVHSTVKGLLLGFVAAGGAIAFALANLFGDRFLRGRWDSVDGVMRRFLRVLRQIHSGHIGDVIAWLVIGVVVIGAGLMLALHVH